MLLSLNELTSGVNSVASMRKTNFRANLGMGGVDMPSMRSAVNDNVGFEIEETGESKQDKKGKGDGKKGVGFTEEYTGANEMNLKNRGNTISEGRRFSNRFPPSRSKVS